MDEHDDVTRKCFRLVCSDRMTRRRRRNDAAVALLASGGDIGVLMCLLLNCYDDVVMTRRGGRGTQHAPLFFVFLSFSSSKSVYRCDTFSEERVEGSQNSVALLQLDMRRENE